MSRAFKMVLALLALFIVAIFLLPMLSHPGYKISPRSANLRRWHLVLMDYASSNNAALPPDLQAIYDMGLVRDLSRFIVPGSKQRPGVPSAIDTWSSYTYTPPHESLLNLTNASSWLLIREKLTGLPLPSDRARGMFVDGHIEELENGRNQDTR